MANDYDTIKLSRCCEAGIHEMDESDQTGGEYGCDKCKRRCEFDEVCEFCHGEGTVDAMEQVYPGEPHTAAIGTQTCICRIHEDDGDDWDPDR